MFKLSQRTEIPPLPDVLPTSNNTAPQFNIDAAVAYNTKSEQYFKKYEADIKRILNTSAEWNSPEFAKATYDWQQKNGFSGKWVDGKLGPHTVGKMAENDPALKNSYDAYAVERNKHMGEKLSNNVLSLKDDVERIRNEMGANDIPISMLMGWIQVESGGRLNEVAHGAGKETGLFQISEGEAKSIGADQDKMMTDRDYAIKTGIELARYHEQNLAPIITQMFPKDSDMYWRLVFMGFVNGEGAVRSLVEKLKASGQTINNWDDVMKWAQYNSPYIAGHSTAKWLPHVDRAFNLGAQVENKPVMAFNVNMRIKNAKRKARALIMAGNE
jgi:hypothetical protein